MNTRRWNEQDLDRALQLRRGGKSWAAIGKIMGGNPEYLRQACGARRDADISARRMPPPVNLTSWPADMPRFEDHPRADSDRLPVLGYVPLRFFSQGASAGCAAQMCVLSAAEGFGVTVAGLRRRA